MNIPITKLEGSSLKPVRLPITTGRVAYLREPGERDRDFLGVTGMEGHTPDCTEEDREDWHTSCVDAQPSAASSELTHKDHIAQEANAGLNWPTQPSSEKHEPWELFTAAEVEGNRSIGWFTSGDVVKQVITLKPYEERIVGWLRGPEARSNNNASPSPKAPAAKPSEKQTPRQRLDDILCDHDPGAEGRRKTAASILAVIEGLRAMQKKEPYHKGCVSIYACADCTPINAGNDKIDAILAELEAR